MMHGEPQTLLLVEDNPGDVRLIREALTAANSMQFTFAHVERLSAAITRLGEEQFAAVLLDLSLPDSQGFETIRKVQTCAPQVPIVVLTELNDEELAIKAVHEGAQDYLIKREVESHTLMRALRHAIERHRLQRELRTSEERYRDLFENANDAIISFTLAGNITAVNGGLEAMLGWSRDELIEQPYRKVLTPASAVAMEERVHRALAGERSLVLPATVEIEAVRKDNNVVPIEIRDNILGDSQGQPVGVLVMARDISARKALEKQRAEFLTMLTHDIKNPLTALIGFADYLLGEIGKNDSAKRDEVPR